jgi:transposase InsO family protein
MLKEDISNLPSNIGRDKFFEILRRNKLLIHPEKQYVVTTNSHHRFRIRSNLIKGIKIIRPNQVLVSDITYIRLKGGFCYLFLVTDVYSRKIVGYKLDMSLATTGAIAAMKMAKKGIGSTEGIIHHSDRGLQYCSDNYIKLLEKSGIKISMGEAGNPYENAIAERVNGILKNEFYLNGTFADFQEAQRATEEAIKMYNNLRPHMSISYMTPAEKYAA